MDLSVKQPQWAQWCSCSGQPGGSSQLLTVLWTPSEGFFWWAGKLGFGKRSWLSYTYSAFKWLRIEDLSQLVAGCVVVADAFVHALHPPQAPANVAQPGSQGDVISFIRPVHVIVTGKKAVKRSDWQVSLQDDPYCCQVCGPSLRLQWAMWTGRGGQRVRLPHGGAQLPPPPRCVAAEQGSPRSGGFNPRTDTPAGTDRSLTLFLP